MWSQNPIEVLKLLASIATPLAIALIGLLINRSIQRQNAIAQRQSSWLERWADEFLKTAIGFNDSATSFMMRYVKANWKLGSKLSDIDENRKLLYDDAIDIMLALDRWNLEIRKFSDFAPDNGKSLERAAQAIVDEAHSWVPDCRGNADEFRQKQLTFNKSARDVHAELLRLKD